VDLLYTTDAIVAVSSVVNNAHDRPEHLVDRREETAWNGKTDDLVGAWVAFRVPDDAHVRYVMMSAGFDKIGAKEDLFFANHRVTQVRISHNGTFLKDAPLSPDVRLPQRIDLDAPGGDFRIEVTAVAPGLRVGWREIALSELVVMGIPGARVRDTPGPPPVRVGGLDAQEASTPEQSSSAGAAMLTPCTPGAPCTAKDRCAFAEKIWPTTSSVILKTIEVKPNVLVAVDESQFLACLPSMSELACTQIHHGVAMTLARHLLCKRTDLDAVKIVTPAGSVLDVVARGDI